MTHIMYILLCNDIKSYSGQWKVPVIIGNRPPPLIGFTINAIPGNRGIIFGGTTIDETGTHDISDVFLMTCSQNTIVSWRYSILLIITEL